MFVNIMKIFIQKTMSASVQFKLLPELVGKLFSSICFIMSKWDSVMIEAKRIESVNICYKYLILYNYCLFTYILNFVTRASIIVGSCPKD